jgi:hypothetical protein
MTQTDALSSSRNSQGFEMAAQQNIALLSHFVSSFDYNLNWTGFQYLNNSFITIQQDPAKNHMNFYAQNWSSYRTGSKISVEVTKLD